jgi:hypothetical protein
MKPQRFWKSLSGFLFFRRRYQSTETPLMIKYGFSCFFSPALIKTADEAATFWGLPSGFLFFRRRYQSPETPFMIKYGFSYLFSPA